MNAVWIQNGRANGPGFDGYDAYNFWRLEIDGERMPFPGDAYTQAQRESIVSRVYPAVTSITHKPI